LKEEAVFYLCYLKEREEMMINRSYRKRDSIGLKFYFKEKKKR